EPRAQGDFLAAVRAAAVDSGVDLVINARIDTNLRASGSPTQALADCIRRAQLYLAAGADCVFQFQLREPRAIRTFVERTSGPVNVLCRSDVRSLAELAEL